MATLLYIKNPKKSGYLDHYGCIKSQNAMAVEFNKQLHDRVRRLRFELPKAALTYVDVYAAKYRLISNTNKEGIFFFFSFAIWCKNCKNLMLFFWTGFMDPMKICCGRHEKNIHVWCGQKEIINGSEVFGGTCATPSSYVSWDGLHNSEAANHWIANLILKGSLSDPPFPIFRACHKP